MNKKVLLVVLFIIMISTNIFAYIPKAEMKIFAVNNSNVGMDANLVIEITPGTGKIYSNVNSQVGSLTQESERNAVNAAERVVDGTKGKYNYLFEIQAVASSIDGPSAGAAMSLLLISMLSDKDLSGKVSITGTITEDGYVGEVGGIGAKAKKAADVGIKLFMIPLGTRKQAITTDSGNSQIVDLPEYAYDKWGMKIVEVETIEDIQKYVSMNIEDIDINLIKESKDPEYIPNAIEYSKALEPMRLLVNKYLIDANMVLEKTEGNINVSKIKDSSTVQSLLSLVDYSKESIANAHKYSEGNYLYTAANEAFLAKIYLIAIDEVVSNPSILTADSTIYNLRIKEIEEKIELTENRSKSCSLDKIEWCISARQRLVWGKNKIRDIKEDKKAGTPLDRIMDYSYALGWIEIANDFLDIGVSADKDDVKFVESKDFKDIAQKYIVNLENEIVLLNESIALEEDIQRRLKAAKTDYEMGWYVTALYDAASAKAIINSRKETNTEFFDENLFISKYDSMSFLSSEVGLRSENNVWSKQYYDHATYFYKRYNYYKNKNITKAQSNIKIAMSIVSLSVELYDIENQVLDYYNKGNIVIEVVDPVKKETAETNSTSSTTNVNAPQEKVYVYKNNNNDMSIFWVIVVGLFLMIIAIVLDNEIRRNNKQQKIQSSLLELEKKLSNGNISKFTYEDMKKSYLKELKEIEQKAVSPRLKRLEQKKETLTPTPQKTNTKTKTKKPRTKPKETKKK
ncbi:MAG TPA: hypothetical protein PK655_02840 [archaeon]|nr:hypothetical protein [archaeon]HPV66364.1 hypothetical protein [archaeon]